MKRIVCLVAVLSFGLVYSTLTAQGEQDDEQEIRELTSEFCAAIVKGDLSILDRVFDPGASNVYYDINEGPLIGLPRLKRVWGAATRSGRLTSFEFGDDLRVDVDADQALETGTWTQTQMQPDGTARHIRGRATILWRRTDDGWRVYHYHASVTPRRN
jgi:ketosteroid isomerase-like protein